MFTYCVGELHLSEDAAYKRIQVARLARRHPAVLAALAEGRVHLTGLNLLAVYIKDLAPSFVDELLEAATHRTKREIDLLIAERFPKADLQAEVRVIAPASTHAQALSSELTAPCSERPQPVASTATELAPAQAAGSFIPARTHVPVSIATQYPHVAPLAPCRYGVQFTLDQAGHDLLRQVQDLLGHEVPRGDLAEVFVRALKAYATLLEKKKHAATENPRAPRRQKPGSRHVSAHVKRVVWERDKGQCTHVSESGHRCEARSNLEYDHVLEYARGGEATLSNIRLRCRAHNRLGAERTYGAEFMRHKIEKAAQARA
jgi:5-methylcytosine-specific restriction endonuclease McrA